MVGEMEGRGGGAETEREKGREIGKDYVRECPRLDFYVIHAPEHVIFMHLHVVCEC